MSVVTRSTNVLGWPLVLSGKDTDDYYRHITYDTLADADVLTVGQLALPTDGIAIDVGANIGYEAIFFSRCAPEGKVLAFEPTPSNYKILETNLRQNNVENVKPYCLGLGKRAGNAMVSYSEQNRGGASIIDDEKTRANYQVSEPIRVATLDATKVGVKKCHLIKVDIEGRELDFLAGAKKFIMKHKPMMIIEANHWCLDGLNGIPMQQFMDELLDIYPYAAAFDKGRWIDLREEPQRFKYENMVNRTFQNIFCGFDESAWRDVITRQQLLWAGLPQQEERIADLEYQLSESHKSKEELQARLDLVMKSRPYRAARKIRKIIRR